MGHLMMKKRRRVNLLANKLVKLLREEELFLESLAFLFCSANKEVNARLPFITFLFVKLI